MCVLDSYARVNLLASLPTKLLTPKLPNFLLISVLEKDNTLRKKNIQAKDNIKIVMPG